MSAVDLNVVVEGEPITQGSMVRSRFGNGMHHQKASALALWRAQIGIATRDAAEKAGVLLPLDDGPLRVEATFVLPRPQSAPKRRIWPHVGKDLDKLTRALLDGLTQCGAWEDDSRVVQLDVEKRYVGQLVTMPRPGVLLTIRPVLLDEAVAA
jgi:Holliday junction resolvase RusA-like endonuclease